jgi:Uma2 family endonuclease
MEPISQATQREITLESLALVRIRRPDVHVFNELLVQYSLPRRKRPGQVVPDNMVVVHAGPILAEGSYDVPLQPAPPFWMLEYVTRSSRRKDYKDNMQHYEKHLKVPYYLLFRPDEQELILYRHTGKTYEAVKPNEHGRLEVAQLEIEAALREGWVRFWFRGELLPLPGELLHERDEARAEAARLRAELLRLKRQKGDR